tara:strand:+ start:3034 stop:3375 length:342 start_codon:yes stop_codon:yes gene_type:complete
MSRVVDIEEYRDKKRFMEELEKEMSTLMYSEDVEEIEEGSNLDYALRQMGGEVISLSVLKKDGERVVRIHHLDYTQKPPVLQHITVKRKDVAELALSLSDVDACLARLEEEDS